MIHYRIYDKGRYIGSTGELYTANKLKAQGYTVTIYTKGVQHG
jgi:hypothetical protein